MLPGLLVYEALLAPSEDPGVHPCDSNNLWPNLDSDRVHAVLFGSQEIFARLKSSLEFAQSPRVHPTYFRGPDRPIKSDSEQDGYRNCRGDVNDCTIFMGLVGLQNFVLPTFRLRVTTTSTSSKLLALRHSAWHCGLFSQRPRYTLFARLYQCFQSGATHGTTQAVSEGHNNGRKFGV